MAATSTDTTPEPEDTKAAEGRRSSDLAQKAIAKHGPALAKYEALCDRIGVPPAAVALAWQAPK